MKRLLAIFRLAIERLVTIVRRRSLGRFNVRKAHLLDAAMGTLRPPPTSFADLGGVWAVNGAYTFHLLDHYKIDHAALIDTGITDKVKRQADRHAQLQLITANFGKPTLPAQLGATDLILLLDVLLHQVDPDWDAILEQYASIARGFCIFNQQWVGSDATVRLLDLGEEEYFRNVPHKKSNPVYADLFNRLDEMHPQHQRPWRDVHNIWQWGITDKALRDKMATLGFKEIYYRNHGPYRLLENFENHAFIFVRR